MLHIWEMHFLPVADLLVWHSHLPCVVWVDPNKNLKFVFFAFYHSLTIYWIVLWARCTNVNKAELWLQFDWKEHVPVINLLFLSPQPSFLCLALWRRTDPYSNCPLLAWGLVVLLVEGASGKWSLTAAGNDFPSSFYFSSFRSVQEPRWIPGKTWCASHDRIVLPPFGVHCRLGLLRVP